MKPCVTRVISFSDPQRSPRKKSAFIALNVAVLLVLAGGTAAYGALSKTVTVSLDGRTDTVRTFSDSVAGVLASKDVDADARTTSSTSPSRARVTDGDTIKVDFAKPVTVAVDGSGPRRHRARRTPSARSSTATRSSPADDAYVSVSRSARVPRSGMQIVVSNPKKLTVKADGDTKKFTTHRALASRTR